MHITYVARRAAPSIGGIQVYLDLLAAEVARQHEVTVLAQQVDDAPSEGLNEGLATGTAFPPFRRGGGSTRPLVLGPWGRRLAGQLHQVDKASRRGLVDPFLAYSLLLGGAIHRRASSADLLHSVQGGNAAAAAVVAGRALHVPVVITPHAHPGQWDDDPSSGKAYRRADAVIACNHADAAVYRGLGVDDSRLHVVWPCVPPVTAQARHHPPGGRLVEGPVIVFLGRRDSYKGIDLVLDGAEVVSAGGQHQPTVVVMGGGPAIEPRPGLRVIDVGRVDEEEKSAWLASATMLCLPSSFESFGIVVGEAWQHGLPVVTSRTPALRELVEEAGGGLAVERDVSAIASAITRLLDDDVLRRDMGERGRAFWRRHLRPEVTAGRVLDVYAAARAQSIESRRARVERHSE